MKSLYPNSQTAKSNGKSLMSFSLFPFIKTSNISIESSDCVAFTDSINSYKAKWYIQSTSPVPRLTCNNNNVRQISFSVAN